MNCDICKDKGVTIPDDMAARFNMKNGESVEQWEKRLKHLTSDCFCKCVFGQRLLWISSKINQQINKIGIGEE